MSYVRVLDAITSIHGVGMAVARDRDKRERAQRGGIFKSPLHLRCSGCSTNVKRHGWSTKEGGSCTHAGVLIGRIYLRGEHNR